MHFLHTTILKFQLTKHIRVVSATGPYLVYRNIEQLAPNHLRKNRYFYLTSRLRRVQRTSCEYVAFFCPSYISYKMLRVLSIYVHWYETFQKSIKYPTFKTMESTHCRLLFVQSGQRSSWRYSSERRGKTGQRPTLL